MAKKFQAVKALIQFEDKYLFLKNIKYEGSDWDLPGGRKEILDESDEETIKREVFEETNLEIEIIKKLNDWKVYVEFRDFEITGKTYLCKTNSNKVKLSDEHLEYKWFKLNELKKLDLADWQIKAIEKLN